MHSLRDARTRLFADHKDMILTAGALSDRRAWFETVWTIAACGLTVWLGVVCCQRGSWALACIPFVLIAALQHRLSILQHESIHRLLFSGDRLNDLIGLYLIGPAIGVMPEHSRLAHLSHHAHLGTPQDLEGAPYRTAPRTALRFGAWSFLKMTGLESAVRVMQLLRPVKDTKDTAGRASDPGPEKGRSAVKDWASIGLVQGIMLLAFGLTCGVGYYFLFWVLPLFTVTRYLMGIRSMVEHAEQAGRSEDPETRYANTIHCGRLEGFFLAPLGFNHHAEHHLFPKVPSWRWPRLKDRLKDHPAFASTVRVHGSYVGYLFRALR